MRIKFYNLCPQSFLLYRRVRTPDCSAEISSGHSHFRTHTSPFYPSQYSSPPHPRQSAHCGGPKEPGNAQPENSSLSLTHTLQMSHQQNLAQVRASLSPNARTDSSLFLNHDEEILQVVNCDGNNPRAQGIFNIVFIFNLVKTCCCWLCIDWNRATEHVTNVLVLTNQRLIKFKESKGSLNGDFPKRWAIFTRHTK